MDSPVSKEYWDNITPIFKELRDRKRETVKEFKNYHEKIYVPVLEVFQNELLKICKNKSQKEVTGKLIKYLLGKEDYYKVIKKNQLVQIHIYNVNWKLGFSEEVLKSSYNQDKLILPNGIKQIKKRI